MGAQIKVDYPKKDAEQVLAESPIKVPAKPSRWAVFRPKTLAPSSGRPGDNGAAPKSVGLSAKFKNLASRAGHSEAALKKKWIEMKFGNETPSCRTLHA